ncbi:MAG: hypothetical protein IT355_04525 [Gemmatimonadaceae bacterium]|nr:hypothetical protein [Gemmatimonadaceae bacterium]
MKKLLVGAAVFAAIVGATPAVQAQSSSAIQYGISGGLTLPIGNIGDTQGTGFNIQGHATYKPGSNPFAFRGDVGLWTTPGKSITPIGGGTSVKYSGKNWFTVNANVVYNFEGAKDATFVPYVLGGAGLYSANGGIGTNFGINAGGGVTFGLAGFDAFTEARIHNVMANGGSARLIPISFGISFKP